MSAASLDVSDVSDADRTLGPAVYRDEDFPGCESFHLPASGLEYYEGRLEFWDGDTETAWKVCESEDALMAAALACTNAADFRRRVLAQRGRSGPDAAHGGDGS